MALSPAAVPQFGVRTMPPALIRLRFRRTVSALLVVAVLAVAAVFMKNLFQPGGRTVADAESHLKKAQANLKTAMRVVNSADRLAQRTGSKELSLAG